MAELADTFLASEWIRWRHRTFIPDDDLIVVLLERSYLDDAAADLWEIVREELGGRDLDVNNFEPLLPMTLGEVLSRLQADYQQ